MMNHFLKMYFDLLDLSNIDKVEVASLLVQTLSWKILLIQDHKFDRY